MAKRRGFRGFLAARRLSWRYFWSRRTPRRITLALITAAGAALLAIYLALPQDLQGRVNQTWQTIAQGTASLDHVVLLAGLSVILALLCLCLLFMRPYRRVSYLAQTTSAIPPITVYIDAENQLSPSTIRPFKRFLMEHLNGRRADLLYFMDASLAASGSKYKALYRFGFRPVDVPHDPTGEGKVKEAVDKEIAMHAVERALRGPKKQEFILVTGDGDFVGLVYRLVALGHQVQVWATPIREAYRTLATYLDVNVLDLASVISERQTQRERPQAIPLSLSASASPKPAIPRSMRQVEQSNSPVILSHVTRPDVFTSPGEEQLYQAIVETLRARSRSQQRFRSDTRRDSSFRAILGGSLGPRLAGVGYSAGSRLDFWIEHLVTLHVLDHLPGKVFPTVGPTSPETAAKAMFAMAYMAAQAAAAVVPVRDDGLMHMSEVATLLAGMLPDSADVGPLRQLVNGNGPRRVTHTRYFVRCARALGLIEFEDVPDSLDMVRSPRITETSAPDQHDGMTEPAVALSLRDDGAGGTVSASTTDEASNAEKLPVLGTPSDEVGPPVRAVADPGGPNSDVEAAGAETGLAD